MKAALRFAATLVLLSLVACGGPRSTPPLGAAKLISVAPTSIPRDGATVTISGDGLFEAVSGGGFAGGLSATICGVRLTDLTVTGEKRTVLLPPAGRVTVKVGDALTGVLAGHEQSGPSAVTLRLPDGRSLTLPEAVECYDPAPVITTLELDGDSFRAGTPVTFTWAANSADGHELTCSLDPGDGSEPVALGDCEGGSLEHTYMAEGEMTARLSVTDSAGRVASRELTFHVGYLPPEARPDAFRVNLTDLPARFEVEELLANDVGEGLTLTAVEPVESVKLTGRTITFDPGDAYDYLGSADSALYAFTYTVTDALGATATGEASITVTGQDRVFAVSITPEATPTLYPAMNIDLEATVTVAGAISTGVNWSSSDEGVAVIDENGRVETYEEGTATITATSIADPSVSAELPITVEPALTLTIDLSLPRVSGTAFQLPLYGLGEVTVHWGDGTSDSITDPAAPSHDYGSAGAYTINVTGTLDSARFGPERAGEPYENAAALTAVVSWGDMPLTSLFYAFYRAFNLTRVPDLLPPTVTDLTGTFSLALTFNHPVGGWDTSNVTNMSHMFDAAVAFNQPIDGWDTGNVTDMARMFRNAEAFDQPIGGWDTGNVTSMRSMFNGAHAFNQPLGSWDTRNVTTMIMMFEEATSFDQDIGDWDTSNVARMDLMFMEAASFNQDLSGWCVERFYGMPLGFADGADLWTLPKPAWGEPCDP